MRKITFFLCFSVLFFLSPIANAADIEAKLQTSDGTDAFVVKDSNGTVQMQVQSDGKVGIGTTNPTEKLSVGGIIETTTGGIKFPDKTIQTTAANDTGVIGFTKFYTTGDQTYTANTLHEFSHGLGGTPTLVVFELVCIVANNGYSVGDRLPFGSYLGSSLGNRATGYNATKVFYKIANVSYLGSQKTSNGFFSPTPSQWKVNVNAWK